MSDLAKCHENKDISLKDLAIAWLEAQSTRFDTDFKYVVCSNQGESFHMGAFVELAEAVEAFSCMLKELEFEDNYIFITDANGNIYAAWNAVI